MRAPLPRRLLLGPGPSEVAPEVLAALAQPLVGHLDPAFTDVLDDVAEQLRTVFRTRNRVTFPVSGTGSAALEMAIVDLVERGDDVVVGVNGVFGGRLAEVARRAGATVTAVEAPWGRIVEADAFVDAVRRVRPRVAALVHAETSTGVHQPVAEIAAEVRATETLLVLDCVTSLAGVEVDVDGWGIDVAYSGTQKCLSVPPGLAPITFSDRAVARIRARVTPVQSWYLDVGLLLGYLDAEGGRTYHHTAPVSMVLGLRAGLDLVLGEGLEARIARHQRMGRLLQSGLERLGLPLLAQEGHRLPQLTAVGLPDGVDDAALRRRLLEEDGIEVGGGLGELAGRALRIGLMGHGATEQNVERVLAALGRALGRGPG